MQTVRFQSVLDAAGKPEQHLLWVPPEKDKDLQKALKEMRVMTVHQSVVGTKADYGTVGLAKAGQGDLLVFPKSLKKFDGKRVVGIKYELYAEQPTKAPAAKRAKPKPKAKSPAKKAAEAKARAANILEFPITEKAPPKPQRTAKPKSDSKSAAKTTKAPKAAKSPKPAKTKPEPAPKAKPETDAAAELTAIKRKVRQALKALEQGKQVAAYETLKGLLG